MTKSELALFLIKRGFWLIILELTVVRFAWAFHFDYQRFIVLQVIWAIGISMLALSVLIYLPRRILLAFSLLVIAGHNLFDSIDLQNYVENGVLSWQGHFISFLHIQHGSVYYPVIPWITVMSLGYASAPIFLLDTKTKKHILLITSLASIVLFIILRSFNIYGDPLIWQTQNTPIFTLLSFLNVSKYPPSLQYLLITLSISLYILYLTEGKSLKRLGQFIILYGRVPLFFYILHLYLIHGLALIISLWQGYDIESFLDHNTSYGFGLPVVYGVWALIILLLYPACFWFAGIKRRYGKQHTWLRFL